VVPRQYDGNCRSARADENEENLMKIKSKVAVPVMGLALVGAGVGVATDAPLASANTGGTCIGGTTLTATFRNFVTPGTVTRVITVQKDGSPFVQVPFNFRSPQPKDHTDVWSMTVPPGVHTYKITVTDSNGVAMPGDLSPVECGVQPPQVTPPPVPPKAPTCADLLSQYPKAGKARLKAWGCYVAPPKHHPLVPHKTVRITQVHQCAKPGQKSWAIRTTRVVWTRNGKVVKTKVHRGRIFTGICIPPAVTG
jgi:hypothetical protein